MSDQIKSKKVSWFSTGASSAVATWLERESLDAIVYIHIDDQHEDTLRFVKDCERWFERPVEIIQHDLKSVENACRSAAFVNGPRGASCTRMLKRDMRKQWENRNLFFQKCVCVWGFDMDEQDRADKRRDEMPESDHVFPLIERGLTKADAHAILERAGIKRPKMYELGYHNNNCIGCVKGGMGYWNKIRIDFPDVFKRRAEMERTIGATCIKGIYLDELDPEAGRKDGPIVPECSASCELINT